MRALISTGRSVTLTERCSPSLTSPRDVLIAVHLAGLCRTDVAVARGRLPVADGTVLGHEFCGAIRAVGSGVTHLQPGMRVAVNPLIACGCCAACTDIGPLNCTRAAFLGVDRDGAFAEEVVVPAAAVYPLPDHVPDTHGAYLEPLAAALAVFQAPIGPEQQGVVYGQGRLAELTLRLLRLHGFQRVMRVGPDTAPGEAHSVDFAIETCADSQAWQQLCRMLRPRGVLVVKSRASEPVSLIPSDLVHKELRLQAVRYAAFEDALALLDSGRLDPTPLFGEIYPLSRFQEVLAAADNERAKVFFDPRRS